MFHQLDEQTLVSGQISKADLEEARRLGVTLVVNNRADGEDPDQPSSVEMGRWVESANMAYTHVPIAKGIGPADVQAMVDAIDDAGDGKLLAYCRGGSRSVLVWALAKRQLGAGRAELERAAARAGFSLEPIAHLL
jgi:uncharacterized protein (TIGR01244 family)